MQPVVGVLHGGSKFDAFNELIAITGFDRILLSHFMDSGKTKETFLIAIKPNMMVFTMRKDHEAVVTDKVLVESLVDHLLNLGFKNIAVVEAQNDVGRMFRNHNVPFVAGQIGYAPGQRYRIVDLTGEKTVHRYHYTDCKGRGKIWKHTAGVTWRDADFRISFAKCKTHEHDYMTLAVKNIYGCFPDPNKVCKYHIQSEVWEVTARSYTNFPVHFAFVDGWIASDGFQGYKIPNPKRLNMLFGGENAVAVDMEIFKRAGLDPACSRILKCVVEQLHQGVCVYPDYIVSGDKTTRFKDLLEWENVSRNTVDAINILEEVYFNWMFINMKPAARHIDYALFPPKNIFARLGVCIAKQLYQVFKSFKWFRKLYHQG